MSWTRPTVAVSRSEWTAADPYSPHHTLPVIPPPDHTRSTLANSPHILCGRAAATMPPPLSSLCGCWSASRRRADRNVAVVSHGQYVPTFTTAAAWRVKRRWVKRPGDLDLWPSDLESGVRVTCDVTYLCANFSLPRPHCSRLRPDVRDRQTSDGRQTDRRQTASSLYDPAC